MDRRATVFFVATAPLDADGLVNCSPKGLDSLRVIGPRELAYVDLTGSGVETIAHLKENGAHRRHAVCVRRSAEDRAVSRPGEVVAPADAEFAALVASLSAARRACVALIRVHVSRISDSCGYGVPLMAF